MSRLPNGWFALVEAEVRARLEGGETLVKIAPRLRVNGRRVTLAALYHAANGVKLQTCELRSKTPAKWTACPTCGKREIIPHRHRNEKPPRKCVDCGAMIYRTATRCRLHANQHRERTHLVDEKVARAIELEAKGATRREAAAAIGYTHQSLNAALAAKGYARAHMTEAEIKRAHAIAVRDGMGAAADAMDRDKSTLRAAFARLGLPALVRIESRARKAHRLTREREREAARDERRDTHAERWSKMVLKLQNDGLSRRDAEERATVEMARRIA